MRQNIKTYGVLTAALFAVLGLAGSALAVEFLGPSPAERREINTSLKIYSLADIVDRNLRAHRRDVARLSCASSTVRIGDQGGGTVAECPPVKSERGWATSATLMELQDTDAPDSKGARRRSDFRVLRDIDGRGGIAIIYKPLLPKRIDSYADLERSGALVTEADFAAAFGVVSARQLAQREAQRLENIRSQVRDLGAGVFD